MRPFRTLSMKKNEIRYEKVAFFCFCPWVIFRDYKNCVRYTGKSVCSSYGKFVAFFQPFYCDYGYNIEIGENFYSNVNCVILDGAKVKFGDNVFVAPNCGFYTAGHPLDVKQRTAGLEYAKPITIGNNVWIGAQVCVMPGVTIGDNCVIGGGSVVTKDIPANSLAVGNPCRVIREI